MAREILCPDTANNVCGHHDRTVVGSATVALVRGPYKDVVEQSLLALASSKETLVIDVLDIFNEHTFAKYNLNVPDDIEVFAPITAFHFNQFVETELGRRIMEKSIKTIAILGFRPLFLDPNILDFEYIDLFKNIIGGLKQIAAENGAQVLILTFEEVHNCERDSELTKTLDSLSDIVFNLGEMKVCATH